MIANSSWQGKKQGKVVGQPVHCSGCKELRIKQEVGPAWKTSRPAPKDLVHPAVLCILRLPQPNPGLHHLRRMHEPMGLFHNQMTIVTVLCLAILTRMCFCLTSWHGLCQKKENSDFNLLNYSFIRENQWLYISKQKFQGNISQDQQNVISSVVEDKLDFFLDNSTYV